jgi:hypothetical protein
MKRTAIVVVALAALAVTPALAAKGKAAKGPNCTSENIAKSAGAVNSMPESPAKLALSKEVAGVNADMSKGNMKGACAHYAKLQKMSGGK